MWTKKEAISAAHPPERHEVHAWWDQFKPGEAFSNCPRCCVYAHHSACGRPGHDDEAAAGQPGQGCLTERGTVCICPRHALSRLRCNKARCQLQHMQGKGSRRHRACGVICRVRCFAVTQPSRKSDRAARAARRLLCSAAFRHILPTACHVAPRQLVDSPSHCWAPLCATARRVRTTWSMEATSESPAAPG